MPPATATPEADTAATAPAPAPMPAPVPAALHLADLPALQAPLAGGSFIGVTTHADGKHYAEVLLPDQASDLTHQAALAWAKALGGTLPTRPIAALLFANCKALLREEVHWCLETQGASFAWGCGFILGSQNGFRKSWECSAVAVRSIPLISASA